MQYLELLPYVSSGVFVSGFISQPLNCIIFSEEEETACAHTSYALKRPTESVLPNGRSVCYPSFRYSCLVSFSVSAYAL